MHKSGFKASLVFLMSVALLAACNLFTDPATRIAYDIEHAVKNLNAHNDKYVLYHKTPSLKGQCNGPYKVQFDKVGLIAVWCFDDSGKVVSSHTTSYYARFADTPQTWIVDKKAGETLEIDLELHGDRAVIVNVR